jgi:hypothetical protein
MEEAAEHDVAVRRAALDRALAALDRGDPDADPIAVVDCALALRAAETVGRRRGRRGRPQRPRPSGVRLLHTVEAAAPRSASAWTSTRVTHFTH